MIQVYTARAGMKSHVVGAPWDDETDYRVICGSVKTVEGSRVHRVEDSILSVTYGRCQRIAFPSDVIDGFQFEDLISAAIAHKGLTIPVTVEQVEREEAEQAENPVELPKSLREPDWIRR